MNLEEQIGVVVAALVNEAIALVALMSQCDYSIVKENSLNDLVHAVIYTALKIITIKVQLCDR